MQEQVCEELALLKHKKTHCWYSGHSHMYICPIYTIGGVCLTQTIVLSFLLCGAFERAYPKLLSLCGTASNQSEHQSTLGRKQPFTKDTGSP